MGDAQQQADPITQQLNDYSDSVAHSDPVSAQLNHYADVVDRQSKVNQANQIVSEVQSGKRPELSEQDLLPVMKVASLDPETGKLTTPVGRAGGAAGDFSKLWFDQNAPWYNKTTIPLISAMTAGRIATTPAMREKAGQLIGQVDQGVKGLYNEAANEKESEQGQGLLNELGGVVGGTAKWLQGTGIQAATGVQNVEQQLTGKGIDPDLANAQAAVLQGKINHGITTGEQAVGVNPESYAYSTGANIGPLLLPPFGAGEAAGATAKLVRGAENLGSKASGYSLEYGAKTIPAVAKLATKPISAVPIVGPAVRQIVRGISEGAADPVEIVGAALRGDDGTLAQGLSRETQQSIAGDQSKIDYLTKQNELKSDDAVFQKKPNGEWMFDDDSPMLKSPERQEVRGAQRGILLKQKALDAISKTQTLNNIANYARDMGLIGTANTAVGSTIGGAVAGVNAPPGEEGQAAQSGGAFGALAAAVPGHYSAMRDATNSLRAAQNQPTPQLPNAKPPVATDAGSNAAPQPTSTDLPQAQGASGATTPENQIFSRPEVSTQPPQAQIDPAVEEAARDKFVEQLPPQRQSGGHAGQRLTDQAAQRAGAQWDDIFKQYQDHLQQEGQPMPTDPQSLLRGVLEHQLAVGSSRDLVNEVDQAARTGAQTATVEPQVQVDQNPQAVSESSRPQIIPPDQQVQEVSQAAEKIPPQVEHPDYVQIYNDAADAKRDELSNTNRKSKEQEIYKAGLEAMAKAHAQTVGEDSDAITYRTNRFGKPSISGRSFDPANDPFHSFLSQYIDLSPEDVAKYNFLENHMGETVSMEHNSALEKEQASGASRAKEQAESPASARIEGEAPVRKLTKTYVPTNFTFNLGDVIKGVKPSVEVNGFSPDKYVNNMRQLIEWGKSKGLDTWKNVNDPALVEDFQKWVENHKNGYTASGKPIKGTDATPVKPNEDFTPNVIPKDKADLLNAAMNDTSAKTATRKLADYQLKAKIDKQALARQNSPYFDDATGETNKIRTMLGEESKLLESPYETLRPELNENLRVGGNVPDAQTMRPSGFSGDRGAFAEKGLPHSAHVAAGFHAGGVVPTSRKLKVVA